jgi:hypothetical protein
VAVVICDYCQRRDNKPGLDCAGCGAPPEFQRKAKPAFFWHGVRVFRARHGWLDRHGAVLLTHAEFEEATKHMPLGYFL